MTEQPVFIALDFPDATTTYKFLKPFSDLVEKPALKVGMELLSYGTRVHHRTTCIGLYDFFRFKTLRYSKHCWSCSR